MAFSPDYLLPRQELSHARGPGRNHAMLREVAAQRVDQLRSSPHEKIARSEDHSSRLLFLGFYRHKPHCRSRCCLGDGFAVSGVVFLALHERPYVSRWDQSDIVTELADFTPPFVGGCARLHCNQAARELCGNLGDDGVRKAA